MKRDARGVFIGPGHPGLEIKIPDLGAGFASGGVRREDDTRRSYSAAERSVRSDSVAIVRDMSNSDVALSVARSARILVQMLARSSVTYSHWKGSSVTGDRVLKVVSAQLAKRGVCRGKLDTAAADSLRYGAAFAVLRWRIFAARLDHAQR